MGERFDLVGRFKVEQGVQTRLGTCAVSLNLICLMRLELGENVAQMVDSFLVQCLQLFEDVGCLGFPLARSIPNARIGLALLPAASGFVGLFLCSAEVLRHTREVILGAGGSFHLAVTGGEHAQGLFDIVFDLLRQPFVRGGGILNTGDNALPWDLEYPIVD